ncbi:S8 family serine peptidase, partial [Deinococcus arenicola]|nr:hypothetical protein [Deinococcus sp. ZS9-10]
MHRPSLSNTTTALTSKRGAYGLGILALTALLAACGQQTPGTAAVANAPKADLSEHATVAQSGKMKYVQNELVVGYTDAASLSNAASTLNATVVATIPEIQVALLRVSGDGLKASAQAFRLPGLRYAQPNHIVTGDTPPAVQGAGLSAQAASDDQKF